MPRNYLSCKCQFVLFDQYFSIPQPPLLALGNHHSSRYKWFYTVFIFLCLTHFIRQNALKVHLCRHKQQDFLPSQGRIKILFITSQGPTVPPSILMGRIFLETSSFPLYSQEGICSCPELWFEDKFFPSFPYKTALSWSPVPPCCLQRQAHRPWVVFSPDAGTDGPKGREVGSGASGAYNFPEEKSCKCGNYKNSTNLLKKL